MAAGEITLGRRVHSLAEIEKPGDYFGPSDTYHDGIPRVFFLKPNAYDATTPLRFRSVQHAASPPHRFRECPDGSLEIRESLSNIWPSYEDGTADDGWHGFLDEGYRWRQV